MDTGEWMGNDDWYGSEVRVMALPGGTRVACCIKCLTTLFVHAGDDLRTNGSFAERKLMLERHRMECTIQKCPTCGSTSAAPQTHPDATLAIRGYLCDDYFHDTVRIVRV